ncbi:hypothetical protein KSP40_PGU003884 [Platanthera guangdongensis]|uniref:Uncharacterized protein n=1 Tax=Platanthera guangdongensis TaxID=2320717 RepID=A0ABR2MXH4_9ASPA
MAFRLCKDCMGRNWFPNVDTIHSLLRGLQNISKDKNSAEIFKLVRKRKPSYSTRCERIGPSFPGMVFLAALEYGIHRDFGVGRVVSLNLSLVKARLRLQAQPAAPQHGCGRRCASGYVRKEEKNPKNEVGPAFLKAVFKRAPSTGNATHTKKFSLHRSAANLLPHCSTESNLSSKQLLRSFAP